MRTIIVQDAIDAWWDSPICQAGTKPRSVTHSGCGTAGMRGVVRAARVVRRFAHGAGWTLFLLGFWSFGRWSGWGDDERRRDLGEEQRRNITNESSLRLIQTWRNFLGCSLDLLHAVNYHRQLFIQMLLQQSNTWKQKRTFFFHHDLSV